MEGNVMTRTVSEVKEIAARGEIFVNGDLDSHRIVVSVWDEAKMSKGDVIKFAVEQGIVAPYFVDYPRSKNPGWTDFVFKFSSVSEVRKANKEIGQFFFSKATTEWFDSKYGRTLYGSRFFISNDRNFDDTARVYKVIEVDVRGCLTTTEKLDSRTEALRFIDRKLAEED